VDGFHAVPVDHFPYVIGDFTLGLHFLTVEDVDSIAEKFEVFFEVTTPEQLLVDAGADQNLQQNQDGVLHAQASLTNVTWHWWPPDFLSCTDCPDPIVQQPDHNIIYTVEVTDINGCTATDIISITVEQGVDIYFPNIFTPDGDGINDIVMINSSEDNLQIKSLRIYSRWGELMSEQMNFPANDPQYGWDGTYRGKMMNPGVYVWIAEVEFGNSVSKIFSDEVTLIR
jgi:gliding motility-associated-like protein